MIKYFSIITLLITSSKVFSQTNVNEASAIYTDYSWSVTSGGTTTNYPMWSSSKTTINTKNPDKSHNLLAISWKGKTVSTGVNNALLTSQGVSYTAASFKSFPATAIPDPSDNTFIGVGYEYGGTGDVTPVPVENNLEKYLIDGTNGLDMGTAVFNMPKSGEIFYTITGINPASINDGVPDVIVTQVGNPSTTLDVFKLKTASTTTATVVSQLEVNFSNVSVIGRGSWKFYNVYNLTTPTYNKGLAGLRDVRILAFDWADLGITLQNYTLVKSFSQTYSGSSDSAFTAYNDNSMIVYQSISGTVFNDNNAGTPNGNGYANATLGLYNGSQLIATTTSGTNGVYNFSNLGPGTYTVRLTVPTGYSVVGNTNNTTSNELTGTVVSNAGVSGLNFGINLPPVAANDTFTTNKNTAITPSPNILSNDSDANSGTIVASSVALVLPSGATNPQYTNSVLKGFTIATQGTWLVNTGGNLTFTPIASFIGNTTTVQYTVKDNANLTSNLANINITVNAFCTRPAATTTGGLETLVGISTLSVQPNNWPKTIKNGQLALASKSKGFVITRVANSGVISEPKEGMIIYDIQANCVKIYNGAWKCIERSCNN